MTTRTKKDVIAPQRMARMRLKMKNKGIPDVGSINVISFNHLVI